MVFSTADNTVWMPPQEWQKFNSDLGTTPGAADLTSRILQALTAEGLDPASYYDVGQGAGKKEPQGKLRESFTYEVQPNGGYNPEILTPLATREAGVGYLKRHLGIDTTADTFVIPRQLGRTILWDSLFVMNQPFLPMNQPVKSKRIIPESVGPNLGWGLIDGQFQLMGHQYHKFDMTAEDIPGNIRDIVTSIDDEAYAGTILSGVHNASGIHLSENDLIEIFADQDEFNHKREEKGLHKAPIIIDHPYFAAHPRNEGEGAHLATGFDKVLTQHSYSPWGLDLSLSKTYAQHAEGLTIATANIEFFSKMEALWKVNGHTTGYSQQFMRQLVDVFSKESDTETLAHKDSMRKGYEDNRETVERIFPNRVVQSDSSNRLSSAMTTLLEFHPREVLDKAMPCHDGKIRIIENVDQLVEYLANQYGVTVVNNEYRGENIVLRVAQALPNDVFENAMIRLKNGSQEIIDTPHMNAHLAVSNGHIKNSAVAVSEQLRPGI